MYLYLEIIKSNTVILLFVSRRLPAKGLEGRPQGDLPEDGVRNVRDGWSFVILDRKTSSV